MKARRQLEQNGFIDLGVVSPDLDTLTLAEQIGKICLVPGISEVQKLIPKNKVELQKNTYSGNFGKEQFPLHTDLAHWHIPPRYFLLRCIIPDPKVGTFFLNFKTALKGLSDLTKQRALFKPRRKLDNKMFFLRLIQDDIQRWDSIYLEPENFEAKVVANTINSITSKNFDKVYLKQPAQTVLVDNWNVLHGRANVSNLSSNRLIERVYISELKI